MAKSDLDRLKHAYQQWHESRGANTDAWLELLADEIEFGSLGAGTPGLEFSRAARAKSELVGYFGRACWRYRQTGRVADSPKADVWRFKDGKAIGFFEFFDTAQASAASRPD